VFFEVATLHLPVRAMEPRQRIVVIVAALALYLLFFRPDNSLPSQLPPSQEASLLISQIDNLKFQKSLADMALAEAKIVQENFNLRKTNSASGRSNSVSSPTEVAAAAPPPLVQTTPMPAVVVTPPPPPSATAPATAPATAGIYLRANLPDPSAPRRKVTLLLYNQFKGFTDWWREDDFMGPARAECSTECTVLPDRSPALFETADVVLFHVKTHSKNDFPPKHGKPDQKWAMVSLEQPEYAPLMKDAGYVDKFDWTATYDLESSVPTITISPHFTAEQYHEAKVLPFSQKDGFGEPNAVATFVSNCNNAGASKRLGMMEELAKHMPVHNYGKCLKNREEPNMGGRPGDRAGNKQAVLQRYKFYLAFENNKIKDYVSEKVFDGLLGGTLPVYYGADSIDEFMPVQGMPAVIKMDDFADMKELAAFLNVLANDEAKYEEYFKWKKEKASMRFQSIIDMTAYKYTSLCRFCQKYVEEEFK
jgi:hypothetical protein